jgi:hypothetical protein
MNKKRVAKEWLYFLGCLLFGLLVLPLLMFVLFGTFAHKSITEFFSEFFSALTGGRDALITWLFVLAPYLLFQLVRSVIWAYKTTRNP